MSTLGAPGRALDAPAQRREPVQALRSALEAIARVPAGARPVPGAVTPLRLLPAAREAWLDGLHDALRAVPVLAFVVTPVAVLLADAAVLDGPDRALPDGLHRAGVRGFTLFEGAPEQELLLLASLLATDWSAHPDAARALADAVWGADLPHAWFDLVGEAAPPPPRGLPIAALDRLEQPPEEPRRLGTLSPDAAAALRDLRATVPPEPAGLLDAHAAAALTPELSAEVALVRTVADLEPEELGAGLLAAFGEAGSPAAAQRVAEALIALSVDLLGHADVGPLLHDALEAADPDLARDPALQAVAQAAFAALAEEPLRGRLAARVPSTETPELRGPLFSLLSLVRTEPGVVALAEVLPRWAGAVLADTVLLRDPEDAQARLDAVRARLASPTPAVAALGLAMAARLGDPRLLDGVLALGDHRQAEVREAVLLALRQHATPRVRELVVRRLEDAAPAVRIEALRYAVAHRLPEVLPRIEARFQDASLATMDDAEVRASCIAYGRLAKDAAEGPLLDIALGRRKLGAAVARNALHGLRAIGTPRARAALEHVAAEVPRLREEATALLGEAR